MEIAHHAYVMPLFSRNKDPIIGVGGYLLKYNRSGSDELEECRLEIALFMESVGISFGILGHSQPHFERSGSVSK